MKIIDSFLKYCSDKEAFKIELLSKEINNIFLNSKFRKYYFNIIEISKILGLFEENFTEIPSGLLCLGFKKESEFYSSFVETIKEFVLDERIQSSRYSSLFLNINYQNIDGEFLSNLNSLLSLILNNANEEDIKFAIKKLKKAEDSREQRISSVSNNFENIGSEENKSDIDNNKKDQQLLSISQNQPLIQQETLLNSQNSSDKIQTPSYLSSKIEVSEYDEKDIYKFKENSSSNSEDIIQKDNEENIKNLEKEMTDLNIQQEKYSETKQGPSGLKEEKNEIINEVDLDNSFDRTEKLLQNKGDVKDNENTEEKKRKIN